MRANVTLEGIVLMPDTDEDKALLNQWILQRPRIAHSQKSMEGETSQITIEFSHGS